MNSISINPSLQLFTFLFHEPETHRISLDTENWSKSKLSNTIN